MFKGCPVCQTPAPPEAPQCLKCGHIYRTKFAPPSGPNQTQFFSGYSHPPVQRSDSNNLLIAILLWFFVGHLGAHRFFLGHIGTGVAMLALELAGFLTILFGIGMIFLLAGMAWWIIDLVLMLTGSLYFKDGRRIL
jgi:TM2 domain-containing membrane protein YozV